MIPSKTGHTDKTRRKNCANVGSAYRKRASLLLRNRKPDTKYGAEREAASDPQDEAAPRKIWEFKINDSWTAATQGKELRLPEGENGYL